MPELEVYVADVLWSQVDTFFNSGPNDRVYVVREDDAGDSSVQFGDGKTGARLPSGRQNVMVRFRVGTGARGPLKADAAPKPMGRLKQISEIAMPGPAVIGDAARQRLDHIDVAPPEDDFDGIDNDIVGENTAHVVETPIVAPHVRVDVEAYILGVAALEIIGADRAWEHEIMHENQIRLDKALVRRE